MSHNAQPPLPRIDFVSSRVQFRQLRHQRKSNSPTVLESQKSTKYERPSPFRDLVSRILPSRRPERGHTLRSESRDQLFHLPSNNITQTCAYNASSISDNVHSHGNTRTSKQGKALPRNGRGSRKISGSIRVATDDPAAPAAPHREGKIKSSDFSLEDLQVQSSLTPRIFIQDQSTENTSKSLSELNQTSRTERIFEGGTTRRQQRKNLLESGDFLGVQGANPRTGYWDLSDATTSSDPSQFSEDTRRRLNNQAQEAKKQAQKFQEAKDLYHAELARANNLRSKKKKEKLQQKKLALKLRQRRQGKWKLSENGWSSVPEPDLSPLLQSLVGTPIIEFAPGDCLFPLSSVTDPIPHRHIEQGNHFIPLPLNGVDQDQMLKETSWHPRRNTISRKPFNSLIHQESSGSSNTIIHYNDNAGIPTSPIPDSTLQEGQHAEAVENIELIQPANSNEDTNNTKSFLVLRTFPPRQEGPIEREATVISYQSASRQVLIHPQEGQSREALTRESPIITPPELPPVLLEDLFITRTPLSYQFPRLAFTVWEPPIIIKTIPEQRALSINTSITTITGQDLPQHHQVQFGHPLEYTKNTGVRIPLLQTESSRLPPHSAYLQSNCQRKQPSVGCQIHPAGIDISSEHHLNPMKQRTTRLCQRASQDRKLKMKSIPIFTSTSRESDYREKGTARSAARLTFRHSTHQPAVKRAGGQLEEILTPLKTAKGGNRKERSATHGHETTHVRREGTENRLMIKMPSRKARLRDSKFGLSKKYGTHSLVVFCSAPSQKNLCKYSDRRISWDGKNLPIPHKRSPGHHQ